MDKTFLGSNYLETLSMKILDLSEKGVIQSLRSSWWSGSNDCEATSSVTANDMEVAASLDLPHLGNIFLHDMSNTHATQYQFWMQMIYFGINFQKFSLPSKL